MPHDGPSTDLLARIDSLDETLKLVRDLCAGIGAFLITPTGEVRVIAPKRVGTEDIRARVGALARSCLVHPAIRGRSLFSNAEVTDGAESAERSLACVALPVWAGESYMGAVGVVDTWLPELDDEQRAGLVTLGDRLARELVIAQAAGGAKSKKGKRAKSVEVASMSPAPVTVATARPQTPTPETVMPEPPASERSDSFLGEVLDQLPQGLVVTRADGAVVLVNQTFSAMTGTPVDELLGQDVAEILSLNDMDGSPAVSGGLEDVLGQRSPGRQLLVSGGGGEQIVAEISGGWLSSRYAGSCMVTLIRESQAGNENERGDDIRVDELLDALDEGIICCDANGIVLFANRAARLLQGLSPDRPVVGLAVSGTTTLRLPGGEPPAAEAHPMLEALRTGEPSSQRLVLPGQGETPPVHVVVSARPVRVGGHAGAIAVLRDVTAEWNEQEQLVHYALHDPLTGLANRHLLLEELQLMVNGIPRRGGSVSLIFLDVDAFKPINDEHGHAVGDEILRAIARRLRGAVRGDDVVARLGGDEFIVAHPSTSQSVDADRIVARIQKVLSAPYLAEGKVLDVKVSLGWVSTIAADVTPQALLDEADKAMYKAKRRRATEVEDR